MEAIGCIYLIICLINNKKYVGLTTDETIDRRWKKHILNANSGIDYALYRAIRMYGINNFTIEVLCKVPHSKLTGMEMYWAEIMETYTWDNPGGYNMALCGAQPTLGFKHTPEELKKMGDTHRGAVLTPEHKAKTSASCKEWIKNNPEKVAERAIRAGLAQVGKPKKDETKLKISATLTGRKASQDVIKTLIAANGTPIGKTGYKYIQEHKWSGWLVNINNKLYGKFVKTFPTLEGAISARDEFISKHI
jgi:group I intron endonuclease